MSLSFEAEWEKVRLQVRRRCLRSVMNPQDAEDVFQRISLRAFRGYGSFCGASAFSTWIFRIASSEIIRANTRRVRQTLSLDNSLETAAISEVPRSEAQIPLGFAAAVQAAAQSGVLTDLEAAIVQTRNDYPDLTWAQIEAALDIRHGAVLHARAVPRLRVFFFIQRPLLLGGQEAIADAYHSACRMALSPLTDTEKRLFMQFVLRRSPERRAVFRDQELRSACAKVSLFLTLP